MRTSLKVGPKALALLISVCSVTSHAQQNTELPNLPNGYVTHENVVNMPAGRAMGSGNAVDVDSKGNIWVFERCGKNTCLGSDVDPILKFSPDGELLASFGSGMFVFPHGIIVDADDNIWVVDAGVEDGVKGNQIFKFSQSGEVLLELGQPGIRGDGPNLFNEPSDLAIAPNGDLYIADGHINPESNRRIVHLDSNGQFIEAWGSRGTGPLQFDCPHSLAIDSMGRIYVGDRTNNRLQVLSPAGELLAVWEHFGRPSGVRIHDDILYVVDSESRDVEGQYGYNPGYHRGIRIGSVHDGIVREFIPDPAPHGSTSFPEGISVDKSGGIWGASVGDQKVTNFVKRG
jgi:sugar lactone lactonase YvrE